ncbi:MAG: lysoplasmalogenase [Vibrio sp.]
MWLLIIALCAVQLIAIDRGPRWIFYFSKPTPILLMALTIAVCPSPLSEFAGWVITGLLLSAIGDILLMHPKDKFVSGLLVFLFAHLAYTLGFATTITELTWWPIAIWSALGVIAFLLLLPNLGKMAFPVAGYIVVIVLMTCAATEYWLGYNNNASRLALMGATMFMLSDLVLAIDRFRSSSQFSRHVVMFTYYSAQALLTLSVIP